MIRRLILTLFVLGFIGTVLLAGVVYYLNSQLPNLITLKDYEPLLVSEVYDRNGTKIGEFARQKRTLVPYAEIPPILINSFIAAEDSTFFQHGGINYFAILRAFLANLKAGEKVQGASTITQQVARSLLLSNEKTYTRKIKEVLLAYRMESNLSKEDILYLYLNQIYLGQNYYGVAEAAKAYFDKALKDISIAEAALLGGLPKAPSELNPNRNPLRAKERQQYVISRLVAENMITEEQGEAAAKEPLKIFMRKNFWDLAPHYLETVRLLLISKLGEETVMDKGLRIYTSLDLPKQQAAQKQLQEGLRELDKRQGYRGPLGHIQDPESETEAIAEILMQTRNDLLEKQLPYKLLQADGSFPTYGPLNLTGFVSQSEGSKNPPQAMPTLPEYIPPGTLVKAVVMKVDDQWGLTTVRFAESKGLIDIENMKWARTPDPNVNAKFAEEVKLPSKVLKRGDIIQVRVIDDEFSSARISELLKEQKKKLGKNYKEPDNLPNFKEYANVDLEQEPQTEAALLAIDQKSDEVISLVGGYDFEKSKLNRTIQTARQTGSSFKPMVYLAALDQSFTPATPILDAPIVYEEEQEVEGSDSKETIIKKWKPTNHSNHFVGDILFRNALIQSLNVPSVKIIQKIGVDIAVDYARRLGIFSPLNRDFTLSLGSSSVTLYEMTRAFAQIGRLGVRSKPIIIHRVEDKDGKELLKETYLETRFEEQLNPLEEEFEVRRQNYLSYQKAVESGQTYVPPKAAEPAEPTDNANTTSIKVNKDPSKEPPIFFKDPNQLIRPETAYVMTSLLQASIDEVGGTAAAARSLGRPAAGKTGTTSQYYDAWFIGFTGQIAAGVWVGYDTERSLGKGEVGGRAALPIWLEYMKFAHEGMPVKSFNVPDGIVYSSIDNETGRLASSSSKEVVRQAFISGTEPKQLEDDPEAQQEEIKDFYKEDLSN